MTHNYKNLVVHFNIVVIHIPNAFWSSITGRIPLRELVYRVIDLPPSMRPLVYDYGQLKLDTEKDYISQIVCDHVSWL